ncbi:aspartate ammonia-lyase [Yangia mangrovi]|uniref:Aspartate ammonia-lyase n=1 Tax=Alloyangia mangrovi TaxID=1779329 RepID=A0A2A3K1A3_9RHOB|nr:aspartate ammonia-lyase [Alloyangia mangrovi]MCT4371591.1 aspartate ammonia-lyase [Alloyangia mangrovi]
MGDSVSTAPRTRREQDSLGPMEVPVNALYGAQTARAVENFPISGITLEQFPPLIRALAQVKQAAARANAALGRMTQAKADVISKVCDEIIAGHHHRHFPVDVLQGGAGTSSNMNVNEVIANRGLELMGLPCGSYEHLHPNDDVNRAQSTNDVYPTAVRIALMTAVPLLMSALEDLADAYDRKGDAFEGIRKLGRTELQDAVPMTLGAEMRAYGHTLREDVARLQAAIGLLSEVNLGGTAIGTRVAATPEFQSLALAELRRITGLALTPSSDLIEASWDVGVFVHLSGNFKRLATKLSKMASDLRLLSSGPRGGLGEISLPPMQPGSSLMPGKANPVIPEMVNQVAFQVIGIDVSITCAAEGGQLQLNPFEPLIAYGLLHAVQLLRNAVETLRLRCVEGIEARPARCAAHLSASTANFAALVPEIGYDNASALARDMMESGEDWDAFAKRRGLPTRG